MADFEDANTPTLGQQHPGPASTCATRSAGASTTSSPGRQGLQAQREDRRAVRAAARLAPAREARARRRRSRSPAASSTSGSTSSTTRRSCSRAAAGPYFYLPKLESHLEARLWNDVFVMAQDELGIPRGTIKATVLIETILARVRDGRDPLRAARALGRASTAGRWDYIFSCIKKFRSNRDFCLADRALVTMTTHFMQSYAELLIKTCHRRNIHAMGGMAAQIPVKNDEQRQRRGVREGEGGQGARGDHTATTARGSRIRALVPVALRGVRPADAARPTRSHRRSATTCKVERGRPAALRARAADHREGPAAQHQRRDPVHRRVARGAGRGADLQPDGGRRDRRDLALAGVAVDALAEGRARRRPQGDARDGRGDDPRGDGEDPRRCSATRSRRDATTRRRRSSRTSSTTTRSSNSSRCRRTSASTDVMPPVAQCRQSDRKSSCGD